MWRQRMRKIKKRLRYSRKRARCLGRHKRRGEAPHATITMGGKAYTVTGMHRSDLTPDWKPVLDCDVDEHGFRVPTTEDVR